MTTLEAEDLLMDLLRRLDYGPHQTSHYGYDVYLPLLLQRHFEVSGIRWQEIEPKVKTLLPLFADLSWHLCRRGILRPGIAKVDAQSTSDGRDGFGFCITELGRTWLAEEDRSKSIPNQPSRFGQIIDDLAPIMGRPFQARAHEALRCYGAQAYFACCVLCGAAAESILYRLSTVRIGVDETDHQFRGAMGRSRIENSLFGQSKLRDEAKPFLDLINYWRGSAAHSQRSDIGESVAYTSLLLMIRFGLFAQDHYSELTESR